MTGVIVPMLLGVVKPVVAALGSESRELRRIRQHAQLRSLLPDDGDAAKEMDALLKVEVAKLSSRTRSVLNRKVNKSNLAAIMLVSVVGGCISYVLALLAQTNLWGWSIFFWILFIIWILIVFIFVFFGGLPNFYTHNDKNSKE